MPIPVDYSPVIPPATRQMLLARRSEVRRLYKGLKQLPDIYSELPDKKLFPYEPGGERGSKFSINGGKVTGVSVGSRSIGYVEGSL
ncbi:MAG: hypothetical protein BVN33_14295 [Proteobacteria bacterium ST_bin13]|nr:MAG: hypothetical protein BVN33_14295 [Proteobacteria bacterium ST_bin13]